VELWEALVTFFCFIVLVVVAYGFDKRTSARAQQEEASIQLKANAAKYSLRQLTNKLGIYPVIVMAQGELPTEIEMTEFKMNQEKIEDTGKMVVAYYKEVLGEEQYANASFEELMDVIRENNLLERLVYRKAVANQTTLQRKNFVKLDTLQG
jgi:hypothetical protein